MEYKEFKKYTKNAETYTGSEVDEFEVMAEEELDNYQNEVEYDSGNLSCWDHIRAIITFRKQIADLKEVYKDRESDIDFYWETLRQIGQIAKDCDNDTIFEIVDSIINPKEWD